MSNTGKVRGRIRGPRAIRPGAPRVLGFLLAISAVESAEGFNGTNVLGYGPQSAQQAGADLATVSDTSAVLMNPAGLANITASRVDVGLLGAYTVDGEFASQLGYASQPAKRVSGIAGLGYATRPNSGSLVLGVGAFLQSSAGSTYEGVPNIFGTTDEYSSTFGAFKASIGGAFQVTDRLSVGISGTATLGKLEQRLLPNTSVSSGSSSYFGLEVKDATGVGYGFTAGLNYRISDGLVMAATYSPRITLPLEGEGAINFASVGLGTVRYDKLKVSGIAVPEEIAIGVGWSVERATLVMKIASLGWSNALRSIGYTASGPSSTAAPSSVALSSEIDWKNQTVVAAGGAYLLSDRVTVRAGLNYGTKQYRLDTLTPVFLAIDRLHLNGGATYQLANGFEVSAGVEYLFRESVEYTNPTLPFGPNVQGTRNYVAAHIVVSRRW